MVMSMNMCDDGERAFIYRLVYMGNGDEYEHLLEKKFEYHFYQILGKVQSINHDSTLKKNKEQTLTINH